MINKQLIILFLLIFSLKGQAFNPFIKIDFPDYSIQEKKFQASLILSQPDFKFTSMNVRIISDKSFQLISSKLKNQKKSLNIPTEKINSTETLIKIKLNDADDILANQLLIDFICEKPGRYNYRILVKYFYNDEEILSWNSKDNYAERNSKSYFEVLGKNNDYFLKFAKGAKFPLEDLFSENANLFQFWFKLDSLNAKIFNFTNHFGDTLLRINSNKFNFLEVIKEENQIEMSRVFISKSTWHRLSFHFDKNENKLIIFFDGYFFSEIENIDSDKIEQDEIVFQTELPIGIDEISLKYFEEEAVTITNKNEINLNEAKNIKLFSFRNINETVQKFTQSSHKILKNGFGLSEINLELSIKKFDSYIDLEWKKNSFSRPSYFVVEKSFDGVHFQKITKILEIEQKEKYNFADYVTRNQDISYYKVTQVNTDSTENYSSTIKVGTGLGNIFELKQNYPNPFNPITQINVEMFEASEVQIAVFDVVGKKIVTIFEGTLSQGGYTFQFDGSNFPSGLYFCEVKTPFGNQVQKMLLAK